ncbi:unnamed protein product [Adineta ricciae]|uniref:G domain-containing protein n=1 Tax=Adineta ricciae TaxID=249248 RepID=A0A815KE36_ADIRI|nr:unnamed protein product [Adineta ricciae]
MSSDSESQQSNVKESNSANKLEYNVVIFGESGAGKSALINLIYDDIVVKSSDCVLGCTMDNAKVTGSIKGYPDLTINLYDTAGLSESTDGNVPTSTAFVQLIKLAYAIPNGINLLICCHSNPRISTEQFKANYRIFIENLCEHRIPCLFVRTNCDHDNPPNKWWIENCDDIKNKLKYKFIDGVCVSTIKSSPTNPNVVLNQYLISRINVIRAITTHALRAPISIDSWKRKVMIMVRSSYNKLIRYVAWLGFQEVSLRPELEEMFLKLQFTPEDAKQEAAKLLLELNEKDLMAPYQEIKTS